MRVLGAALVAGVLLAAVLAAATGLSASLAYALGARLGHVRRVQLGEMACGPGRPAPPRVGADRALAHSRRDGWMGGNADLAPQDAAHALLVRAGHGHDDERRAPRSPVARRTGAQSRPITTRRADEPRAEDDATGGAGEIGAGAEVSDSTNSRRGVTSEDLFRRRRDPPAGR